MYNLLEETVVTTRYLYIFKEFVSFQANPNISGEKLTENIALVFTTGQTDELDA